MPASTFVTRLVPLLLCGFAAAVAAARLQADEPPSFPEAVSDVEPPAEPAHRTWFVDDVLPEDASRVFRDQMNKMLGNCLAAAAKGQTEGVWPDLRRSEYFGMYAVWGLSSPDSRHAGDARLGELLRAWMDERYPAEAGDFKADWKAWYLYGPVVEITARPHLREIVGGERLDRAVQRLLEDARDLAERRWPNAVTKSVEIVNFAGHGDVAALTLGWVLAAEYEPELAAALFARAAFAVRMIGWHMQPNGTIRYLYKPDFEGPQLVAETMYYHCINTRALYLHWWFTGDEFSLRLLDQQRPYYKFRVMPWAGRGGATYGTHYHSAIWWKELWRTFWPDSVALAAAATGDGQLATIALTMADRGTGADRKFADWSVHGFQQLARRKVAAEPRADQYLAADPDIGGLRMRFGEFSTVFSSNSYGFTLAGALTPTSGLAGAYPLVRLDPLASNPEYAFKNLHIAGLRKPRALLDIRERAAVAGAEYIPHDQRTTWRDPHVSGPWRVRQLWLYLPDRIAGMMILRATAGTEARNAEHIFRLMTDQVTELDDRTYAAGDLRLRVVATNLENSLVEPARKFSMNTAEPWRQLVLSDQGRPAKPAARARAEQPVLPASTYAAGQVFFSLVELRTAEAMPAGIEMADRRQDVLAFSVQLGETRYLAAANFDTAGASRVLKWRGKETPLEPGTAMLLETPPAE